MTEQAGPAQPQRDPLAWAEPLPDGEVERALVVAAHPDDADFGSAGTIAGWVDAGIAVTLLLCTRGEQGGFDDTPREEMPRLREREQRAASAELGVTDVRFLDGHSDGWLEPSWELQHQIVRVLRQVRPQRVLCQSPAADAAAAAGLAPRPPRGRGGDGARGLPRLGEPLRLARADRRGPRAVEGHRALADGHPESSEVVDITDRFDRKVAALRAHASQTAHLGDGLEQMLRGWNEGNAARAGLAPGRLAETFAVSRITERRIPRRRPRRTFREADSSSSRSACFACSSATAPSSASNGSPGRSLRTTASASRSPRTPGRGPSRSGCCT